MPTFHADPHAEFMNNRRSLFLSIEAVALGGPSSLLFIFGLPYIVGGSISELVEGRLTGPIGAVGSAWTLLQFWSLAFCTISQRPYRFGLGFGLGVVGSIGGIAVMHVAMPYWFSAALIGLPFFGAIQAGLDSKDVGTGSLGH
ncbi:hypothetical protein [Herbaspirillum robiniae]|uniref:hypothetical protein n=1 Tax=Herbaspirillum robiniae TaxID=2014887 RepID=UPI00101AD7A3|nr:hypothetical protein [Herbaspirillum robiniae]